MTRFESITAVAVVALIGAAWSPAFAQYIVIDGTKGGGESKAVTAEVKGAPNGKASRSGKGPKASVAAEPEKPVEPTFTAEGGFLSTKEKARESAVQAAIDKLHVYLLDQEPPIRRMPTPEIVRRMLIEKQEKVTEETIPSETTGKTETMYRMTVAVKVEPEHIRELRSRERSSEALWVLAGLGGLAALSALFFRIDAWTKGYLTSWLVLGTVGATTLLAGLWWWAK